MDRAIWALNGSVERRGKNHCIQGTNASIIKRAMGCGFDKDQKPYLWHTLPQYRAKVQNMVHDELVMSAPKDVDPAYIKWIENEMAHPFDRDLAVPLVAKCHKGINWAEAH